MSETVQVAKQETTDVSRPEATFVDLMMLAETLVKTGFLPAAIKTPAQAVAIILTGRELGIGPMQSLRSVGIIQGKPVLAADLQLGLFHRAGGKSRFVTLTETEAVIELHAPWLLAPHQERFGMDDAKRAGLLRPSSSWATYPKAMLRSRAITAGLKSIGFEPCAGVYDPEELGGVAVDVTTGGGRIVEPAGEGATLEQRLQLSNLVKRHRDLFPKDQDAVLKAWLDDPVRTFPEVADRIAQMEDQVTRQEVESEAGKSRVPA